MSKKRILILGASKDQIPMIQLARRQGFHTVVADFNANAPGIPFADEFHLVSIRDEKAVEQIAKENNVDGITSMITEAGVLSIYHSCNNLGLPNTYSLKSAEATVSKERMREILVKHEINDLPFALPKSLEAAEKFATDIGFPIVLKSSDSGGQNGLFKVNSIEELRQYFSLSQADSLGQKVILEKFVQGPEINVVYTVFNGEIKDLIISDRIKDDSAFGIVKRHQFPSIFSEVIYEKLKTKCQKITDALEIKNAVVFPQFIYSQEKNEATLLEIGVRIPGGIMDQLLELATGINLQKFVLDIALGQLKSYKSYREGKSSPSAMVTFFNAQPGPLLTGKIHRYEGIGQAKNIPGVANLDFFFQTPDHLEITPLKKGKDRFFYVVSFGDNAEVAHNISKEVFQKIQFYSEDGSQLMKQNFNFDEFYGYE